MKYDPISITVASSLTIFLNQYADAILRCKNEDERDRLTLMYQTKIQDHVKEAVSIGFLPTTINGVVEGMGYEPKYGVDEKTAKLNAAYNQAIRVIGGRVEVL